MRTKFAYLISKMEGYGLPGKIPTVRKNPGNLRHGPNIHHDELDPNAVGFCVTDELGWQDLERQLRLYASRGYTVEKAISLYAPTSENDTRNYLNFICKGLGCLPAALVSDVLKIPA